MEHQSPAWAATLSEQQLQVLCVVGSDGQRKAAWDELVRLVADLTESELWERYEKKNKLRLRIDGKNCTTSVRHGEGWREVDPLDMATRARVEGLLAVRQVLIRNTRGLAIKIANGIGSDWNCSKQTREDLQGLSSEALIRAIDGYDPAPYDPAEAGFASYAGRVIRRELVRFVAGGRWSTKKWLVRRAQDNLMRAGDCKQSDVAIAAEVERLQSGSDEARVTVTPTEVRRLIDALAMAPRHPRENERDHEEEIADHEDENLRDARIDAERLLGNPSLPKDQRDALDMHYLQDRSYDEIAAKTREKAGTVRQRVFRGLGKLKKRVSES